MTDAIEILQRDHDEIRRLLAAVETSLLAAARSVAGAGAAGAGAAAGARAGDGRLAALVEQVIIDESGHEAIEEQYFWPLVRRRVHDGARLADQAISQEQEAKQVLARLERHDSRDAGYGALIRRFLVVGRAHIDFEETQVWPGVRLALSEQELDDLGEQLEQGKRLAPTRPHPNMPPTAEVLKVVAPIAAATDWIRDVLGGRRSR
jgi:Hemerythrin HHE cation binding domain